MPSQVFKLEVAFNETHCEQSCSQLTLDTTDRVQFKCQVFRSDLDHIEDENNNSIIFRCSDCKFFEQFPERVIG